MSFRWLISAGIAVNPGTRVVPVRLTDYWVSLLRSIGNLNHLSL